MSDDANFKIFWSLKPWIRIRIDLKCWIRIRICTIADPEPTDEVTTQILQCFDHQNPGPDPELDPDPH